MTETEITFIVVILGIIISPWIGEASQPMTKAELLEEQRKRIYGTKKGGFGGDM